MSFMIPQPFKCPKCGYERQASTSLDWPSPSFGWDFTCPKCWEALVREIATFMEVQEDGVDGGNGKSWLWAQKHEDSPKP